jgi:hypothetical protein
MLRCALLALVAAGGLFACRDRDGAGDDAVEGDDADAASTDDTSLDTADAGLTETDACASTAIGDLEGTSRVRANGSGGYSETSATVTWTLVETVGCIDRYEPSGTATPDWAGGFCTDDWYTPATGTIAATDGRLTLDRSTVPATYTAEGETRWTATLSCDHGGGEVEESDSEAGGHWLVGASGALDGGAMSGLSDSGSVVVEWSFTSAE